jgi:hypothetical protein
MGADGNRTRSLRMLGMAICTWLRHKMAVCGTGSALTAVGVSEA